jgi:hypothetical protein
VWIEVPILKSEELLKLQTLLIGLDTVQGREVFNGVLDSFRPHVTVSLLERPPNRMPGKVISGAVLRRRVQAHLALGLSGDNYSLVEVLYRIGE